MKKLLLMLFLVSCGALQASNNAPLPTVAKVDLNKYLGKWYEIARFDQTFQKGCTATEANYSLRKDGTITVINKCNLNSPEGELKVAKGRAWVKNKETNAQLKVQFFLPFIRIGLFAGNYYILDLDKDYSRVLVGDPSRKYLWILSRAKKLEERTYLELVQKAEKLGFDTSKLLFTTHNYDKN